MLRHSKEFPKRLTKKVIFSAYSSVPQEDLRIFINEYLMLFGKSKQKQLVPELILFYIVRRYGQAEFYKFSIDQEKKFNLLETQRLKEN